MHNVEHDDGLEYLVAPSHLCQNPNHAHHHSHHTSYRYPVADTVVEESTGGSIVTVISTNSTVRTNDLTPDIILTHSESVSEDYLTDNHTIHSLLTKSIDQMDENNVNLSTSILSSSSSLQPSLIPVETTAQATDEIPCNNNEMGTDFKSKSIVSVSE